MRNSMNPYGGVNPLIDKMIGNAYDIVKYVARYLREIRYVAENMETVYNAAHGGRTVVDTVGTGITPVTVPLPAGVTLANLQDVSVIATDGTSVFFPGADTFNFGISGGNLVISFDDSIVALVDSDWRSTFVYTPAAG